MSKRAGTSKIAGRRDLPRLGGRATQRHSTRRSRKTDKQRWRRELDI